MGEKGEKRVFWVRFGGKKGNRHRRYSRALSLLKRAGENERLAPGADFGAKAPV
jgi:hypothetical protein